MSITYAKETVNGICIFEGDKVTHIKNGAKSRYKEKLDIWVSEGGEVQEYSAPTPVQHDLKMQGVEFNGVLCSATKYDMWGLLSIKDWITAGNTVNFEFENGNALVLDSDNYQNFIDSVFMPFRSSFLNN